MSLKASGKRLKEAPRENLLFGKMTLTKVTAVLVVWFSVCVHGKGFPIIIDTDIGPYPDDVGAFSILHTFATNGVIDIRATLGSNAYEGIVPVMEAMNLYFNHSDIPIGVTKDPNAYSDKGAYGWPQFIIDNYPHPKYEKNYQAVNAVKLYRKVLASAEPQSITILSIGHFTNLANLLRTKGDKYSPLNGKQLVRKKVSRLVAMAGIYPRGEEWNIVKDVNSVLYTLPRWPRPILFVGFELGEKILCGMNLVNNSSVKHSPVQKAFELTYLKDGVLDGCFDEVTSFLAVRGLDPNYSQMFGTIEVFANGTDIWHPLKRKTQMSHAVQMSSNERILSIINPLLEH